MTASATLTATPRPPTATPLPAPPFDFIFARGANQFDCVFALSTSMRFSNGSNSFPLLAADNPVRLRSLYRVMYVAPGLGSADYLTLQQMVAPGGVIEQFVSLGGVAVINVASTLGDQDNVAPDGVGFSNATSHNTEHIEDTQHRYVTGLGFAGESLTDDDFTDWLPTDAGTLTNVPEHATVLLRNDEGGPTWVEYPHFDGRVIVTTLSYCWSGRPNSDGAAARNLLRYSRFYNGLASTPGPTVTATLPPSPTLTRTPSRTPTRTPTGRGTPTPSPTASAPAGMAVGDVIRAIFADPDASPADVNGDGAVTAADVPAAIGPSP